MQVATLQNVDFHYFDKGFTILQNEVKVHFEKKDNKLLMLDLKRPKRIFVFSEKSNLNITQIYEEEFGIKNGEPS